MLSEHCLWQIVYPSGRQATRRFGFGLQALKNSSVHRCSPCKVKWDIAGDFCDSHPARSLEN